MKNLTTENIIGIALIAFTIAYAVFHHKTSKKNNGGLRPYPNAALQVNEVRSKTPARMLVNIPTTKPAQTIKLDNSALAESMTLENVSSVDVTNYSGVNTDAL